MSTSRLSLRTLNESSQAEFSAHLDPLFEGPPWIVERTWQARPFATRADLYRVLCDTMYAATPEQKMALLQAHPDLVGRAALAGTLTPASSREQASAGLDALSPQEIATFTHLNQEYTSRFDFPFIICVRENRKASILAGFSARLHSTRAQEIDTALGEVAKICRFRLHDLIEDNQDVTAQQDAGGFHGF